MVSETQTVRTPRVVEKRTPIVQTVRVPKTVCLRVPIDECGNPIAVGVPITSGAVVESPTPAPPQSTQNGASAGGNGGNGGNANQPPQIDPKDVIPRPEE
jgi:hypothetical protein